MCFFHFCQIFGLACMSCNRFRALAADVTRVMLEVGSQGKLGSQAHVADVEGVWLELV